MRVFLFALLLGSLVANAALFVAPYNWGNDRHPPGARAQQTGGSQVQSSAAQQATKIQIACEPNCAAKHTDEHSDEQWILRYLRKTVDDPVAGFTGLLFVATVLLALLARTQIRDGRIFQRAYINAVALGVTSKTDGMILGHIVFKNVGHLPAANFRWIIKPMEIHGVTWKPPKITDSELWEFSSVVPIAGEFRRGTEPMSPPPKKDGEYLFVWGRVKYLDGFKGERTVDFCHT